MLGSAAQSVFWSQKGQDVRVRNPRNRLGWKIPGATLELRGAAPSAAGSLHPTGSGRIAETPWVKPKGLIILRKINCLGAR